MAAKDPRPAKPSRPASKKAASVRGTNPEGGPDAHPPSHHGVLPPVDDGYEQSDTNERIDRLGREERERPRTQTLFPYLYVRAVPGDQGARPLYPPEFWESCDIHLVPVGSGPFDFADSVLQPVAGQSYRVFVHVWNLGRLAAYGARLKAWWIEPGFFTSHDPQYNPHFIGGAYFDLGDRDSSESHRLVEVSKPWTVVMNHEAHECLMVAVECATDPWDGKLNANTHRHVAQRNLNLVAGTTNMAPLLSRLGAAVSRDATDLLIRHSTVGRADFSAAHDHGLARTADAPRGWNTSGLAFGRESLPLAAVRRGRDGLRFFDLRPSQPAKPAPSGIVPTPPSGASLAKPASANAGVPVKNLGRELPGLLQQALGTVDLSAKNVAKALGSRGEPRLLRLSTTDSKGEHGGYSIVVAH